MLYEKYLETFHECPFDKPKKSEILFSNNSIFVILARAPYSEGHLLIIPYRHVSKISELNKKEKKDLDNLLFFTLEKLHKKYENITMLYREGTLGGVGKSIKHLHIHLIPNMKIGSYNIKLKEREIYSEQVYLKKANDLKKELKEEND